MWREMEVSRRVPMFLICTTNSGAIHWSLELQKSPVWYYEAGGDGDTVSLTLKMPTMQCFAKWGSYGSKCKFRSHPHRKDFPGAQISLHSASPSTLSNVKIISFDRENSRKIKVLEFDIWSSSLPTTAPPPLPPPSSSSVHITPSGPNLGIFLVLLFVLTHVFEKAFYFFTVFVFVP